MKNKLINTAAWIFLLTIFCLYLYGYKAIAAPKHSVAISCCSYHFDRDAGYNETNLGVAYRYALDSTHSFEVGAYKNSEYRNSTFIGVGKRWDLSKDFQFSLSAGVLTGYLRGTIPYILPTLSYKDTIHLHVMPTDNGGVALSFTAIRW